MLCALKTLLLPIASELYNTIIFRPKFVNPISDSSNTTRDDSIQSIAHATVSNLPVAPAAGSSTLAKCRECKVGTA